MLWVRDRVGYRVVEWPSFKLKLAIFFGLGHRPTDAQMPVHQSTADIIIVGGGERAGKSKIAALECVARLAACEGRPVFLVGEKYERCIAEFDYIAAALLELDPDMRPEYISRPAEGKQSCTIKIPHLNTTIITLSAVKGMAAIRATGRAPAMILICEAGLVTYDVFLACLGRVAEAGGVVICTGSFPDDTGWYAQKYEEYRAPNEDGGESFAIPSWSNTVIYPAGEKDPKILKVKGQYPRLDFLRFIGAIPQPPATLVCPEFRYSTHVPGTVKFDEQEPVWLAVDPGYRHAYAVLPVQFSDPYLYVIDEVYRWAAEYGPEAGGEAMIEETMKRPWWGNVVDGVICVGGLQHHSAESQIEVWSSKAGLRLKWRKVPEAAGIQRLKTFLQDPISGLPLLLLSTLCKHTAKEFSLWKYPAMVEGRPISEKPIDRDNDAIKALIYLLYYLYGPVDWEDVEVVKRESPWKRIYGRKGEKKSRIRLMGE